MNIAELKKLIRLFEGSQLNELEMEQEGSRVVLKKGGGMVTMATPHSMVHPHVIAPAIPESALPGMAAARTGSGVAEPPSTYKVITSPMVGTFYRASSPTTPPYVEVGSTVRKGGTVCIIEAMKLMNEIESDVDGAVVRVLVENGQPVEFGQPLFEIDPN